MVPQIVWSKDAIDSYTVSFIIWIRNGLKGRYSNSLKKVRDKLHILQQQPRAGKLINKKFKIHRTLVHPKVSMAYQYKPRKREIVILLFWNHLQDGRRLSFF